MRNTIIFFLVIFSIFALQPTAYAKNKSKKQVNYCLGKNYSEFKKRTSQYDNSIKKHSKTYGISMALIKSIITAESCFNSMAESPKGAQGLMQLMPVTAKRFGVSNSFDTDANIKAGTRYLKFLLKYFKDDFIDTIAAYNAGEGTVKKYKGVPPYKETREYISKVSTLYKYYSQGGGKKAYHMLSKGHYSKTFFTPQAMHHSRLSPYKNIHRNISRGKCESTSTRLKKFTKVQGGDGVWQRIYTVQSDDTLSHVVQKTGVHKNKIMKMNGLRSRARLNKGEQLLVWECRRK